MLVDVVLGSIGVHGTVIDSWNQNLGDEEEGSDTISAALGWVLLVEWGSTLGNQTPQQTNQHTLQGAPPWHHKQSADV